MKETWEPFQSRTSWIQTILTDDYLICFYQSIAAAKLPSAIHSSLPSLPNQISPYFSLNLVLCRWILPTKSWHIRSHLFLKFWKWPFVHPMLSVALEWAKLAWALGSKLLCSILLFCFCPSRSCFSQASHRRTHELCYLTQTQCWG